MRKERKFVKDRGTVQNRDKQEGKKKNIRRIRKYRASVCV